MSFAESYLDFMLCVLVADGVLHENEKQLFSEMLDNSGVNSQLRNKYEVIMNDHVSVSSEEYLVQIVKEIDPDQLPVMIRDAYLMASIDGNVHESEIAVINKFLKIIGMPDERFEEIREWALVSVEHLKRSKALFAF